MSNNDNKIFLPSEDFYKDEEYLKEQERIFAQTKSEFRNFLPVEFFHWVGMENSGERGIVSLILEDHPEYLNIKNKNEETALMVAARLNLDDTIKVLLDTPGIDVNYYNENGNFLMYAVQYRSNRVINLVLDHYPHIINWDCRSFIDDTVFHLAAAKSNFKIWNEISEENAKKYPKMENRAGKNCLILGVEGYLQYKNPNALDVIVKHFNKDDVYKKSAGGKGISVAELIRQEEISLRMRKHSTQHIGPLKFLLGIEE